MPRFERIRKVEAVVISHHDYGETDRLIKIFSREEGKLTSIAKGVRRVSSRKAPHLEPFTRASLVLAVGKTFWIITQADTLADYPSIRGDLQKIGQAAYILELADQLSTEYQPDAGMYRLVVETLERLDRLEELYPTVCWYELRILDAAGFRPELTRCVGCGGEIQAKNQFFSARQGGVVCPACGRVSTEGATPISLDALRYLRHFQRSAFSRLQNLRITEPVRKEIRHVLDRYIATVLEHRLHSPGFLEQIQRM